MYLCLCKGITESDVRDAGRAGIVMPCQIKAKFGLKDSGCCGRCAKNIRPFVELATSEHRFACQDIVRTCLLPLRSPPLTELPYPASRWSPIHHPF